MLQKPTRNFIISLVLFIMFFPKGKYIPTLDTFFGQNFDWIISIGIISSSIFALVSILGFVRLDKKKSSEKLFLAGNILILTCGILMGLVLLVLSSGLPPQD